MFALYIIIKQEPDMNELYTVKYHIFKFAKISLLQVCALMQYRLYSKQEV